MLIARQFVAVKMEEFVMKIQKPAHALLDGKEKCALIAVSQAFTELIAHKFVNALMERLVITLVDNAFVSQALWA